MTQGARITDTTIDDLDEGFEVDDTKFVELLARSAEALLRPMTAADQALVDEAIHLHQLGKTL
jgi:hypothetical protein